MLYMLEQSAKAVSVHLCVIVQQPQPPGIGFFRSQRVIDCATESLCFWRVNDAYIDACTEQRGETLLSEFATSADVNNE